MGRPSNREQRRAEILQAFARVLAEHGVAGATMARVAEEAGFVPGLIHHHFRDKDDLLDALLGALVAGFHARIRAEQALGSTDALAAYGDAALKLGERSDTISARCWVGLFAEALRNPQLFKRMRRLIDSELSSIEQRAAGRFATPEAGAVLAYTLGALVLGAFAPQKTAGFAAPGFHRLVRGLLAD